jgi:hypothetical protein
MEERVIVSTRRDFVKMVAGASLAPSFLRASQAAETAGLAAKVYLEPFDYQGVRLLDGMLKTQYDRTREYYLKIPNNSPPYCPSTSSYGNHDLLPIPSLAHA